MKKIFIVLIITTIALTSMFATTDTDAFKNDILNAKIYNGITERKTRMPNNAELLGMGGAGIAIMDSENAFFANPAALGEGKFRLSVPSVDVTVYHVYDLIKKDAEGKSALDKIIAEENDTASKVSTVLNVVGTQFAPLAKVDATTSIIFPFGIGLGVYASDTAYTYSGSVIDELDVTAAVGYGKQFNIGQAKLSCGVTGKFSAMAFTQRVKASDIIGMTEGSSMDIAVASGWAPLLDAGVNLSFHGFNLAVVCSDINLIGGYTLNVDTIDVQNIGTEYEKFTTLERNGDIVINTDPNLKFGIGYELDTTLFDLKLACDVTDIIPLIKDSEDFTARKLLKHVNAGAEIGLLDMFVVRGGLNSGYYTVGASFDLWLLRIDAAYFWEELGTAAGQRGLDGLTIRFNIGWER